MLRMKFGLNQFKNFFYSEYGKSKHACLKSKFSGLWHENVDALALNTGISYGDRRPSVSRGILVSICSIALINHDYIGDPGLAK